MEKLKVLIGRSSQCDYTIENPAQHGTVSGKHATISETDVPDCFLFEDHSLNGSYINGKLFHNCSCKIWATDHITLGRTYILPLDDIVKRYFSSRPTKEKTPQGNRPKPYEDPYTKPQASPSGDGTSPLSSNSDAPTRVRPSYDEMPCPSDGIERPSDIVTKTITVEKVPDWFWVLYGVSIFIAFAVGFFSYSAII